VLRPQPLEGSADAVLALSVELGAQGAHLTATARVLERLARTGAADWDGPAGTAFAARAAAVAPVVTRVATRFSVASVALRPLADALQSAQATSAEALADWDDAWPRFVAAGDAMSRAESSTDPAHRAEAARHRVVMVAQGERCSSAHRRSAAAAHQWQEADSRCAGILRGLLDDGLADPWAYDLLTTASREARGASEAVGMLGPATLLPPLTWLDAVGTAGDVVSLAADSALLLGYHEGSLGAVGLRSASLATGPVSGVLKRGARATNQLDRIGPPVGSRAEAARRRLLPAGARLKAGVRAEWDHRVHRVADPTARFTVRWTRPPRTLRGAATWARTQTLGRVAAQAQNAWLQDLALAGRNGPAARTMLLSGWAVESGGAPVGSAADRLDAPPSPDGHQQSRSR
jgi:hypothetical protein